MKKWPVYTTQKPSQLGSVEENMEKNDSKKWPLKADKEPLKANLNPLNPAEACASKNSYNNCVEKASDDPSDEPVINTIRPLSKQEISSKYSEEYDETLPPKAINFIYWLLKLGPDAPTTKVSSAADCSPFEWEKLCETYPNLRAFTESICQERMNFAIQQILCSEAAKGNVQAARLILQHAKPKEEKKKRRFSLINPEDI